MSTYFLLQTMKRKRLSPKDWATVTIFLLGILIVPTSAQDETKKLAHNYGDGTLRRIRVPILMYHYISPIPSDADDLRLGLTIEPDVFQAHMQYLSEEGYQTITLYQLDEALARGTPLPAKPVVLTFDDGYVEHYTRVFPTLLKYGFTGTFFVITGRADTNDRAYLNWEQIQEMAENGMSMEPHTKTHVDLRQRDQDFLVYEILGSIESLETHIGQLPGMFAYPSGRYDEKTLAVIQTLPIQRAVTTEFGASHTTDNSLALQRVRVSGGTGVPGLAHLLDRSQ